MQKFIWYLIATTFVCIVGSVQSCKEKTICPEALNEINISKDEAMELGYDTRPYYSVKDSINLDADCSSQKVTAMIICSQIFLAQMDSAHARQKEIVGGIRP